jgi:hypothetical protein
MDQAVTSVGKRGLSRYAEKQAKKLRDAIEAEENSKGFIDLVKCRALDFSEKKSKNTKFQNDFKSLWGIQGNKNPGIRLFIPGIYAISFDSDKVIIRVYYRGESLSVEVTGSNIGLVIKSRIKMVKIYSYAPGLFSPDDSLSKEERRVKIRLHTFLRMVLERQDRLVS